MEWSIEPGDVAAVPVLRRRIMACLAGLAQPGEDLSGAELVVGELLSNAVAHTEGPAWISLRWDGPHPLLSVADLGPGFGPGPGAAARTLDARLPDDPLAVGGRGLYLVTRLSRDVAVSRRSTGGSVVSVTLDLARP